MHAHIHIAAVVEEHPSQLVVEVPRMHQRTAAAAGSVDTAAAAATSAQPRIGWDLELYPKQLQAAYWRDKNGSYVRWDMQVAGFLLIVLTGSVVRQACTPTLPMPDAVTFARQSSAWLVLAGWLLLATCCPKVYHRHRILLVLVFKSALALPGVWVTNEGGRLVALGLLKPSSTRLLVQASALHGLSHLPALCVGLPLPFWLQLGCVLGRMAVFCLGGATRELVSFASAPAYAEGISSFNSLWMRLVQSGSSATVISDSSAPRENSTAMTVALLTMHLSAAALSMYLAYISQWVQLRAWLREQAEGARQQAQQQQPQQQQEQPQQGASACPRGVGGVLLTPRQLVDMGRSHAATLLLDGRGVLGHASMACFHACVVNLILLGVLLLSRLLVLQVGPRVLPGPLLRAYYPPRPELGGDVCWHEDEPRLSGIWGSLLFVLGL